MAWTPSTFATQLRVDANLFADALVDADAGRGTFRERAPSGRSLTKRPTCIFEMLIRGELIRVIPPPSDRGVKQIHQDMPNCVLLMLVR